MTHIKESIEIPADPQVIWDYVQDYRRRAAWDVTTARFEPIDMERVEKDVRLFVRTAGRSPMEYEAVYVSYDPYKVSAVKMTRAIRNVPFKSSAGSWRYADLGDGKTEFTMTFDYELMQGVMNRWIDRFFIEPVLRRGLRKALENLQNHFADQGQNND
jgi:ribosome-associated toxin RatA of RatAB toxin-antitoxin module